MIVDQMAQDNAMHFYANKEILWAYDANKDVMQCNAIEKHYETQ